MNVFGLDRLSMEERASRVAPGKKLVIKSDRDTVTLPPERVTVTEILDIEGDNIRRVPDAIGGFARLRGLTITCPVLEALPAALHHHGILWLPAYSPDKNPIERYWANMKRWLRTSSRDYPTIQAALERYLTKAGMMVVMLIDYISTVTPRNEAPSASFLFPG